METYKLPSNLEQEINQLDILIKKYQKEKMSSSDLKSFRVPFGVYEQRKKNTFMIRIRCPGGLIKPDQLIKVAQISKQYAGSKIHITTRQEIQLHNLKLTDIVMIMKKLQKIGLSSRGGGGNTLRNIIVDEKAGIKEDELFDVTPYALALTTRFIAEEDSWTLPRKLKIAFSGSPEDRGFATITDLGFIAKKRGKQKGFKVYVAGGFGSKAQISKILLDFVSEDKVYPVAKAIKNIFWKYGNRKNKYSARLRFLWQFLGEEEFRKRFQEEYSKILKDNYCSLKIRTIPNIANNINLAPEEPENEKNYRLWLKRFVEAQKQEKLYSVLLGTRLGFIDNQTVDKLGKFINQFGDNSIRITKEQNFLIRNIKKKYLPNLFNFLKNNLSDFNNPLIYYKLVSCAGASTCKLGICLSRGLALAISNSCLKSNLNLDDLQDFKLNISGCLNSCGQHQTADLGFSGKALRKGKDLYPAYNVIVGALISEDVTEYGDVVAEINARDLPKAIIEFFKNYLERRKKYSNFRDYLENGGKKELVNIVQKYQDIPFFEQDKSYYIDWGAEKKFSLIGRRKN
ncbi:MAG: nitrite/sulfite reductase [Candidatus Omnitrophica bacterium]|nr:nitrite/sulfite reductase [Candidatus Omnitrophota bacterium]